MAKPKGVIRLRHRKEPHLELHVWQDPETKKIITHVVDYERGKVVSYQEKTKEEAEE